MQRRAEEGRGEQPLQGARGWGGAWHTSVSLGLATAA